MVSKKLPHEIKSEETKNKILSAVDKMLSAYDFKYLTVRNICEEAQVAYGSFYHHFENKEKLLFTYTHQLFKENLKNNPYPEWLSEQDYIKHTLWYVVILGCFCEAIGPDLTGYIHKNCPNSIFDETLEHEIRSILTQADEQGYIDEARSTRGRKAVNLMVKDMEILCDGTLMWWGSVSNDSEPLHETLLHLCFNMLFSFCSEKYREADFPKILLTDYPEFEGSIKIQGVPVPKQ